MPTRIPDRVSTQIRINKTTYEKTKRIGVAENRNTNSQIEYFLKKGVEAYELEHGAIVLSDAD